METKLLEMDKLQRSDHDTLIRLEGKVDALITNVAILQSGLDMRIKELEKQVDTNTQWIHDFKSTYKVVGIFASGVGALVSFILTTLALKAELFK